MRCIPVFFLCLQKGSGKGSGKRWQSRRMCAQLLLLLLLFARAPKSQLAVEQPSTEGCWNPPKRDTPRLKRKKKPQREGRRGKSQQNQIPIPAGWVTNKLENINTKMSSHCCDGSEPPITLSTKVHLSKLDRDKIIKATKEKQQITYKATTIRLSADFSTETLQARKGMA